MFKFTEMRPHAGVQVHTARLRHIALYLDGDETDLLKSARDAGLPHALIHMADHLKSPAFQTRLAGYEAAINSPLDDIDPRYLLGILLDQSIAIAKTMPSLTDPYIGTVLQITRGIAKGYGLTGHTAILDLIEQQLPDLTDDLYALMLISTRHPEYRRFCAAQHRAATLIARHGGEMFAKAILPVDIGLTAPEFAMLRVFYGGRILLPQGVDVIAPPRDTPKGTATPDTHLSIAKDEVRGALMPRFESQIAPPRGAVPRTDKQSVRNVAKKPRS